MLLIGSTALKNLGLARREPLDRDYIATQHEYEQFIQNNKNKLVLIQPKRYGFVVFLQGSTPIEFEIAEQRESAALLLKLRKEVDANLIYTIKMSHRYLKDTKHFLKTREDILWLRSNGAKIPDDLRDWFKIRQKETYDYNHPSLKRTKDKFFVEDFYVYDHDSIHSAIKLFDRPAYDFIKEDKAEVFCSKQKFKDVTEEIRLATVYEESCVLALERHQIPNNFMPKPKMSFLIALEKVCTGISSGWWREYAWENYEKVVDLFDKQTTNYISRFFEAKDKGLLLPHNNEPSAMAIMMKGN